MGSPCFLVGIKPPRCEPEKRAGSRYPVDVRKRPSLQLARGEVAVSVLSAEGVLVQCKAGTPHGEGARFRWGGEWVQSTKEGGRYVYRLPERETP